MLLELLEALAPEVERSNCPGVQMTCQLLLDQPARTALKVVWAFEQWADVVPPDVDV